MAGERRDPAWSQVEARLLDEAFGAYEPERVRRTADLQAAGMLSAGVVASVATVLAAVAPDAALLSLALPDDFVTLAAIAALFTRVRRSGPRAGDPAPAVSAPEDAGTEAAARWLQHRYLTELGPAAGAQAALPPSVEGLRVLHRAHVQRFAHDTVWKARGRVPELTHPALVQALVDGEGGGCVHLNGSFVWLLRRLGYDADLHRARVQRAFDAELGDRIDAHAVFTVVVDGEQLYGDVGMGNGLLEAVPLVAGPVAAQPGGFRYRLERSSTPGMAAVFHHDRRLMALRTVEFEERPAALDDFAEGFHHDATDPSSTSLRQLMVNSRREDGVTVLMGRTLMRHGEGGRSLERVRTADEWERTLREELLLGLPGMDTAERDDLWERAGSR